MEAGSTNAVCTLNGVDIERFRPKVKNNLNTDILVVGFSGAFKHDKLKGLSEYIIPAVEMVDNAELRIAMSENGEYLKHSKMVDYYNGIDLYICASSSEGFSLSVLEAAACGIPVLSTRVGGSEDLIVDGINGYYVDRNVADISNKITVMTNTKTRVQLGYNNRKIIEQFWSWEIRVGCWTSFIKSHIK
jgi:glycosyltransferase involved in cell wall biosynthesis